MVKICCAALALLIMLPSAAVQAENIVFPDDAGIIDLTDYGAVGDGATDNTDAINAAMDSFPSANKIFYLPNGTYLISDTICWPEGRRFATDFKRSILQGQSESGTIIKLKDNAPLYSDANNPRPMIYTGPWPADRFRNAIRNLTVDIGAGNPGAIGVQFNASNQGCIRNVTIKSSSGNGKIGLDMSFAKAIGPCLIKNVTVIGFEIGIATATMLSGEISAK